MKQGPGSPPSEPNFRNVPNLNLSANLLVPVPSENAIPSTVKERKDQINICLFAPTRILKFLVGELKSKLKDGSKYNMGQRTVVNICPIILMTPFFIKYTHLHTVLYMFLTHMLLKFHIVLFILFTHTAFLHERPFCLVDFLFAL